MARNLGTAGQNNNWLAVELEGGGGVNRDAVGSRVYVETSGAQTLMQEVKSGSSFAAGNEMTLYFGLGIETADSVTVKWADGLVEQFTGIDANQKWLFTYPVAQVSMSPGYTTTVAPSSIVTLTHTITNEGNRSDTFTMTVDSTHGWATVSPPAIVLAPGESAAVEIIVQIPALGNVLEMITLMATSANDPTATATVIDTVSVGWFHHFLPIIAKPD
jgi:hypothetical protein